MEESANIEFLYGGCLPLQPGSQVSYAPGFSADLSAEIIIAQNFRSVHSFFDFLFGTYKLAHNYKTLVCAKTFIIAGTG